MSATMTLGVEPETTSQAGSTWYEQFKHSYTLGGFRTIYHMWEATRLVNDLALTSDTGQDA